jgi:hypothetical protein
LLLGTTALLLGNLIVMNQLGWKTIQLRTQGDWFINMLAQLRTHLVVLILMDAKQSMLNRMHCFSAVTFIQFTRLT